MGPIGDRMYGSRDSWGLANSIARSRGGGGPSQAVAAISATCLGDWMRYPQIIVYFTILILAGGTLLAAGQSWAPASLLRDVLGPLLSVHMRFGAAADNDLERPRIKYSNDRLACGSR